MIWRAAVAFSLLIGPAFASPPVSLSKADCPFGSEDVPDAYQATCFQMAWTEDDVAYQTQVATIAHKDPPTPVDPIVYIPGGPGDAPVNKGGDIASILALFPGRMLVTLNPRGVKGAQPRPTCTFGPDFWDEDIPPKREEEITAECRAAIDLDLEKLDAPYLAQDIDNLIRALEIERAGVFAVSYGTESALHLLADQPKWLGPVILDSVSMPGALGTPERLAARDRFLGVVDRLCFTEKQCDAAITDKYDDLLAWTAQFSKGPLNIKLGPPKKPWSLDQQQMLDFLASLAAYPDGAGYAPLFIEAFEASRKATGKWVAAELENGFGYALKNFPLLYGAFSDSAERNEEIPKAGSTRYPFDVEEQQTLTRLFIVWNRSGRTEKRFIDTDTERQPASVPILILSGGVDSLTPLSWALELDKRFGGTTHFVFPELAHAVSFGTDADIEDRSIAHQLRCAPQMVRAFISKKPYGDCDKFLREKKP